MKIVAFTLVISQASALLHQNSREQRFDGSSLQASNDCTFHVVEGNHDHQGDVQAQIAYSSNSDCWTFLSQCYVNVAEVNPRALYELAP